MVCLKLVKSALRDISTGMSAKVCESIVFMFPFLRVTVLLILLLLWLSVFSIALEFLRRLVSDVAKSFITCTLWLAWLVEGLEWMYR